MQRPPKWLRDLGNTPNAVFAVDQYQRILTWNKAAADLFGWPAVDVVGRYCHEVIGGRRRAGKRFCTQNCTVQRCVRRGRRLEDFDLTAATVTGQQIHVAVSITTLQPAPRADPVILHVIHHPAHLKASEEALDDILNALRSHGLMPLRSPPVREPPDQAAQMRMLAHRLSTLTRREHTVLDLLTRGLSAREIADELSISPLTIRSHIRSMLRKTHLHRQAELVALALRSGLP